MSAAPEGLLAALAEKQRKSPAAAPTPFAPVDVTSEKGIRRVKLALRYLEEAPPAVSGQGGHAALWKVARCLVREYELPIDTALEAISALYNPRCEPPWSEAEILHKLEDARDRAEMPAVSVVGAADQVGTVPAEGATEEVLAAAGGKLQAIDVITMRQVLTTSPEWDQVIRFDVLSRQMIAINPPIPLRLAHGSFSDGDATAIQIWFAAQGFAAKYPDIRRVVESVSELPTRGHNPIVAYLDGLPSPDGPSELDRIHETILNSPDGPVASQIFKKQLVAAVRRARAMPGLHDTPHPVDHRVVVVLDGPQNAGKTSLLRLLGGHWYASVKGDVQDKDTRIAIAGNWIVEMEEMASAKRSDREAIKAFVSSVEDNDRRSYGRSHEKVQRSYVLFGTSNELRFDDPTGNARFAPIKVGKMNQANAERLRDRLWAEANQLALSSYSHYLTPEEAAWANERCVETEEDALSDKLRALLSGIPFITIQEAYEAVMGIKANPVPTKGEQAAYADSLRRIGCKKTRISHKHGWLVPKEIAEQPLLPSVQAWLKADNAAAEIRERLRVKP